MKCIELEEIQKILERNGVKWEYVEKDKTGFKRDIVFIIYGVTYWVEWYCNVSTITIGKRYSNYKKFIRLYEDTCSPVNNKELVFTALDNNDRKFEFFESLHVTIEMLDWQKEQTP